MIVLNSKINYSISFSGKLFDNAPFEAQISTAVPLKDISSNTISEYKHMPHFHIVPALYCL